MSLFSLCSHEAHHERGRAFPVPVLCVLCLAIGCVALGVISVSDHAFARALSEEELEQRRQADEKRRLEREKRREAQGRTPLKAPVHAVHTIGILVREKDIPPALSNLDPIIQREGFYGAQIAIEDNNTTGVFIGHDYRLEEVFVPLEDDVVASFRQLAQKTDYILLAVEKETLLTLADTEEAQGKILFNISARDDTLRNDACRPNVLHVIPSDAMRADAIIQFLVYKGWKEWLLIRGSEQDDEAFANALKRAASKFGGDIVEEKIWDSEADIRRTAKAEIPLFTKHAPSHDVMLMADVRGRFGEYVLWNSWRPTLMAGSQGLVATSWHRTHERWGAAQMQNRFRRTARRWMGEWDYAAWVAVRSVGETLTRISKKDAIPSPQDVLAYMQSEEFAIAAYKGIKVTYRPWNGQLRQPILLASPRSIVAVAPMAGYLHPLTPLDTLGTDEPLSTCQP